MRLRLCSMLGANSTILTIIVGVLLGELLIRLAVALRGRK
jgi:hypothetical protein